MQIIYLLKKYFNEIEIMGYRVGKGQSGRNIQIANLCEIKQNAKSVHLQEIDGK